MAKLKVFSVYDAKVELYARPFQQRTQGEALRSFIGAVNDPQSTMSLHPEDFHLFYLGEYDESSGRFENNQVPQSLGCALEYHEGKKTYKKTELEVAK